MAVVSSELVELHRRIYSAMNGHDVDALIKLCDPAIEVRSSFAAVGGGVYRGHAGVRVWQQDLEESWGGDFCVVLEAFFDFGERTMALGELRGRGTQSGVEVAMPGISVAAWRGALCVSHMGYLNKEDALAELNVAEDALQPIAP